jgi:site-specific DNA-methyltransferase (adenine-specific)
MQGEALDFLRTLPGECADLVFLDPPFNLGKNYADGDRTIDARPPEAYAAWLAEVVREAARVLRKGGALYLYHMPIWAMRLGGAIDGNLQFRHWIAVSMKNGFVRGQRLYPAHYALLYFTKGPPRVFRRPKLKPARCRHCNELIKDYGGYLAIIAKKGINLSDFWDDLSPVRHATTKHRRANELPGKLFERIMRMSGRRGGLYVDPFAGSGSGVVAAAKAGMRFAACDLLPDNCALVCERLKSRKTPHSQRR